VNEKWQLFIPKKSVLIMPIARDHENIIFFFLEHEGELRIFVLRRKNNPITDPKAHLGPGMGLVKKLFRK